MNFLAPLFLLGATAIALPVILHLIRRSSRERIPFSSLMFLLPTPPRVTRRSKLENVLLLIFRCIVISLLAFAFARPFFSKPMSPDPGARAGQKLLILLDASASMRRAGLWSQGKEKVRAFLNRATPADRVAFYTFERDLRPVVSFEQWTAMPVGDRAALVSKRLDELAPSWGATRLGNALVTACELFESPGKQDPAPRLLVLITDLQEGSRLDGLQGFEWPHGIDVTVELVQTRRSSNAGVQFASERDEVVRPASDAPPRFRISNASDSKREQFQIGWRQAAQNGPVGGTLDVYVPPGQSRVVPMQRPAGDAVPDRVVLTGDDEDFDNTAYVVTPDPERTDVFFLGSDRPNDPAHTLFYLRRAFQQTRNIAAQVVARGPAEALAEKDLAHSRLVVVNEALPEATIRALRKFLESDNAVLVCLRNTSVGPTVAQLAGIDGFSAEEVSGGTYAMLGQIDFQHPLFAPFADPRYSDFTMIHFWKHRRVLDKAPLGRVLARFDNGDPALLEFQVGKGRLWVLTSGWQPEDSQLALSSKFVPLIYAMLEQSGAIKEQQAQYWVGDSINLGVDAESVTIRKPDASEAKVLRGEKFSGTDVPGVYTVTSVQPTVSFAVNVAPEESNTAPLPMETLERLGVPIRQQIKSTPREVQQRKQHLQAAQLENRQKLWRWLIVAALVVLVVETWLAGRLTQRGTVVAN
jgi:hypothetical protein